MKRISISLLLAAAACSGGGKSKGSGGGDEAAGTYTLVSVDPGDAACYVTVKDSTGAEYTRAGSVDLCPGGGADASNLIGFPVALTWATVGTDETKRITAIEVQRK